MQTTVKIEGLTELDAALAQFKPSTGKGVLRRVGKKAAKPMAQDMEQRAPKLTGALKLSCKVASKLSRRQRGLHHRLVKDSKASVELFIGPGPLPQAIQEEFGNIHQRPHPFVRPAWDGGKDAMLAEISKLLGLEIQKTAARLEAKARRLAAKSKA